MNITELTAVERRILYGALIKSSGETLHPLVHEIFNDATILTGEEVTFLFKVARDNILTDYIQHSICMKLLTYRRRNAL